MSVQSRHMAELGEMAPHCIAALNHVLHGGDL